VNHDSLEQRFHCYNLQLDIMIFDVKIHIYCLPLRYLTGMVDKRTLEKYEREAKEKNRETW